MIALRPSPALSPRRQTCPSFAPADRPFPHHIAAGLLILASVVLHLAYLIFDCPLDLAPDEAHYWHWSRHLDWSYYSKGPLVAWLIRGSCELFGGMSVQLVGSEMLAVRLPALACHATLLAGIYAIAAGSLRSPRLGLAAVAAALTLPPVTAGAVLMTIDPPFLACWCWALVAVRKAVDSGGSRWWAAAGALCAVGVLAKYTMLLLPVAVGAFLLVHRGRELRRLGFWLFLGITALGCVPILVWNATHDWVSVRHVLGQAGIDTPGGIRWAGPVGFAAGQFGFLLGYWFVAFAGGAWACRPRAGSDTSMSLVWWGSVPVWCVFALTSLGSTGQINWAAPAYVGGLVPALVWVRRQLAGPPGWYRRVSAGFLAFAVVLGIGLTAVAHYPTSLAPLVAQVAGPPTERRPVPVRGLDPTCRLRGWRTLAAEVDQLRDRVKAETGTEPVLAGMAWTIPGELAFHCRNHPEAFSFGSVIGERRSQYDLWRPNPVADAQAFRGRSFLYVGDDIPPAAGAFDRLEPPIRVVHAERGVPVAAWTIWVGHGYRGFPEPRGKTTRY